MCSSFPIQASMPPIFLHSQGGLEVSAAGQAAGVGVGGEFGKALKWMDCRIHLVHPPDATGLAGSAFRQCGIDQLQITVGAECNGVGGGLHDAIKPLLFDPGHGPAVHLQHQMPTIGAVNIVQRVIESGSDFCYASNTVLLHQTEQIVHQRHFP